MRKALAGSLVASAIACAALELLFRDPTFKWLSYAIVLGSILVTAWVGSPRLSIVSTVLFSLCVAIFAALRATHFQGLAKDDDLTHASAYALVAIRYFVVLAVLTAFASIMGRVVTYRRQD